MQHLKKKEVLKSPLVYGKLHWIVHKWSILWLLMIIPMLLAGQEGVGAIPGSLMIAGIIFVKNSLKKKTSYFEILYDKIVLQKGIISKQLSELPLDKFEAVRTYQSVLGRALDYGTVTATGTGGVRLTLDKVASPLDLKNQVQSHIRALSNLNS